MEGHVQTCDVTVFSMEEELSKLREDEKKTSICVLKTPKFWQWCNKSRETYSKGEKTERMEECQDSNV